MSFAVPAKNAFGASAEVSILILTSLAH